MLRLFLLLTLLFVENSANILRTNSTNDATVRGLTKSEKNNETFWQRRPLWQKILIIIVVIILSLVFLLFLAVWVVLPVVFSQSKSLQRFVMFMPIDSPKNPDYENPSKYGIEKAYNFHMKVTDVDGKTPVNIGAWLIVSNDEKDTTTSAEVSEILANTKSDICLYLHGVLCTRVKPIPQYEVVRQHFLVISIDHRGYGDSGLNVEQTEEGIVNDHLQIYDWVRSKTKNDIYYWGHSLGSALSVHTVRRLKETRNVIPKGLILESPFTCMRDEVYYTGLAKIFRWLAYFEKAILRPLDKNKFHFHSTTHILHIDCPIMIMHAEDDNVIPYFLGKKLAEVASTERNLTYQGNVYYHQFPELGYKHNDITRDPQIPKYVEEFKRMCDNFVR